MVGTATVDITGVFYATGNGAAPTVAPTGYQLFAQGNNTAIWTLGAAGAVGPVVATGIPTRGLTTNLIASVATGVIKQWYDQAPSKAGQYWNSGAGANYNGGSGFNGNITYDFTEALNSRFILETTSMQTFDKFIKYYEFTFAAVLLYNGSLNFSNTTCPQIINEVGPNNPHIAGGLSCGKSTSSVIFSVYVNDTNGAGACQFAESVAVAGNAPHYVIGTFGSGTLTLYVDALTPVVTTGVGNITIAQLTSQQCCIGSNDTSSFEYLQAQVQSIMSWNVCLTSTEITQLQTYLIALSGI
jgi:hypothetical protein